MFKTSSLVTGGILGAVAWWLTTNFYFGLSILVVYTVASILSLDTWILVILAIIGGALLSSYLGHPVLNIPGWQSVTAGTLPALPPLPNWSSVSNTTTTPSTDTTSSTTTSLATTTTLGNGSCTSQCCDNSACIPYMGVYEYVCVNNFCEQKICQTTDSCSTEYECIHQICTHI